MRIAFFTDTYMPQINGVVTSIRTFTEELERQGHTVLTVAPATPEARTSTEKVWRCRSMAYPFHTEQRMATPFTRKIREFPSQNIDVIHVQTPFLLGKRGLSLGKQHGIPTVYTHHTRWEEYLHYFPPMPLALRKRIAMRALTERCCNRCDRVIAPSTDIAGSLRACGIERQITTIPTGIAIPPDRTVEEKHLFREKHNLDPRKKTLIFVGRLGKEKNLSFLLDCFQEVTRRAESVQLLIVGDGPDRAALQRRCTELAVEQDVIFTGYLPHDDVFTAYNVADVVTFPSKSETQGLSLLEGLATGKPAVCVRATGTQNILWHERGGLLSTGTVADFSTKVLRLLEDQQLHEQKCTEARERAQDFSATKMTKKLIRLYEELAQEAGNAPPPTVDRVTAIAPAIAWSSRDGDGGHRSS